jgi:methylphosphotriester-DNA--protein-cysteine methyltransferase
MSKVIYEEHDPPAGLATHVQCFWTSRSDRPVAAEDDRVLPDGCADLIFDFGDRDERGESVDGGPRSYVVGTMTEALLVRRTGRADMLAVRFRPGGAHAFLRVPLGDLTDQSVALDALGEPWRGLARRMHAAPVVERRAVLAAALAASFRPEPAVEQVVRCAWLRIVASVGALPVRALADGLGVGERRLQRLFRERIGLTPKEAGRLARFRTAVGHMRRRPATPLGRVGLEAGYYDQPHFIREFSRFAGLPPEAWRRERRQADADG